MTGSRLGLVLANGLTLGNALSGFAGVLLLALDGPAALPVAAALVFAAWLFDLLDGPVARRLGVAGPFGAVLDSMADVVSFGLLPALLVAEAGQGPLRPFAVAAAGVYLCCALVRLGGYTARALAGPAGGERLWFTGLPATAAAMTVAALAPVAPGWAVAAAAALAGPAMVSKVRYPDLPGWLTSRRLPLWTLAIPVLALAGFRSPWALAAVLGLYAAASPLLRPSRP